MNNQLNNSEREWWHKGRISIVEEFLTECAENTENNPTREMKIYLEQWRSRLALEERALFTALNGGHKTWKDRIDSIFNREKEEGHQ